MTRRVLKRKPIVDRFWEKVVRRGSDDCWEWTAYRTPKGYGQILNGGKGNGLSRAHRISWVIHSGMIPQGMCVLHHCDNPGCVNPAHLFLGTNKDNSRDMVAKCRSSHVGIPGEDNGSAKLSERSVREIRQLLVSGCLSMTAVAVQYGVGRSAIEKIKYGKTWAWLV